MIQKKDSISYTEFIRGKYDIHNIIYILKLFDKMTKQEKNELETLTFSELWKKLWVKNNNNDNKFMKDFNKSNIKFNKIIDGYVICREDNSLLYVNMSYLIKNTTNAQFQEWEFPKGRRKLFETDIQSSIREFREETGINNHLTLQDNFRQFEESFQGSNNIRYRNIYYVAKFTGNTNKVKFDKDNFQQLKEVRDVKWFTYDEVLEKIQLHDCSEKIELFKRMHCLIKKNYL
jgi:ADP-ribose pyrophosphatase YjhB (NUDIX family)